MKTMALDQMHSLVGHQGNERMLALIKKRCFWPGISDDGIDWVMLCECIMAKSPMPTEKPVTSNLLANKPLEILIVNFTQ